MGSLAVGGFLPPLSWAELGLHLITRYASTMRASDDLKFVSNERRSSPETAIKPQT